MSEENSDTDINSLISQLKDTTAINKKVKDQSEELGLHPEDVEQFVIKNSGHLVQQSLEVLENVKDYILASGDPDSISALSELINASSKSIESLNKIVVQNKRSATSIATKTMDIQSKYAIEDKKGENALIGTRDEILKIIFDDVKVIEADDKKPKNLN
jgi:malonyl CoA-acyl carrier protein transacylase